MQWGESSKAMYADVLPCQEFLAAEQMKRQLRGEGAAASRGRGKKNKGNKANALPNQQIAGNDRGSANALLDLPTASGGTFALTSTHQHESDPLVSDMARSQSTLSAHEVCSPGQPRASTALGMQHTEHRRLGAQATGQVDILVPVELCDVGTQCRPMELEEAPIDRILRRYAFSLEWDYGSLGPGLLNSSNDLVPKQIQNTGEEDVQEDELSHAAADADSAKAPHKAWLGREGVSTEQGKKASVLDAVGEAHASMVEVKNYQHGDALASDILDAESARQKTPYAVPHGEEDLKLHQEHHGEPKVQNDRSASSLEVKTRKSDHRPHTSQARPPRVLGSKRCASPARAARPGTAIEGEGSRLSLAEKSEDAIAQQLRGRGRKKKTNLSSSAGAAGDSYLASKENSVHHVLSSSTLFSTVTGRSKSPSARARNTLTPAVGMRFYEVKLTEKETDPPVDYSVDYRRYSYTDFKIPERGEGKSTVDPELIADWIDRAVPRNQDDTHPLFVLCKDLLRKFHQKEIRYAVRKEEDMLAEILKLNEALGMGFQESEALKREMQEAVDRAKAELEAMCKEMEARRAEMQALQMELERYKALEREMIALREQFHPGLLDELAHLRTDNQNLVEKLRELMSAKDLERTKEVDNIGKELEAKSDAILQLQGELEVERSRANEAEATVVTLRSKRPIDHVEEWDLASKSEIFQYFFTTRRVIKRMRSESGDAGDRQNIAEKEPLEGGTSAETTEAMEAEKERCEEVQEQVAACMTEREFALLPADLQFKCTLANLLELKTAASRPDVKVPGLRWEKLGDKPSSGTLVSNAELEEALKTKNTFTPEDLRKLNASGLTFEDYVRVGDTYYKPSMARSWLDTISTVLGVTSNNAWQHMLHLVKQEPSLWKSTLLTHQGGGGKGWDLVRESLLQANIQLDSLAALEVLSGVDQTLLLAQIVGIDPKYIPMLREHWDLFLKWFERFGAMQNGLDAAEEEMRKIREKVKKYALLDMEHMDGEPLPLEDTLRYIGEIIDFKFESDWENEAEQRPRLNMVRALKSYMLRKHVNKRATDEQIKRLCASVLKWSEVNSRVKVFGMCAGMIDILTAWTERATCIWMLWLQELKKLSSPGLESQDPSTLGQSWTIFAPWLGTAEKVVELEHACAAARAALESNYSFGDLPELERAFGAAVVSVPGMTAGVSLDKATEAFMRAWFRQLDNAKQVLVQIFEHFDENNDQELDMQEFLALLKQTPLKIRQHDAMSMFNELAGPDGTMDEDEFSEILVFYKFNSRGLLGINLSGLPPKV